MLNGKRKSTFLHFNSHPDGSEARYIPSVHDPRQGPSLNLKPFSPLQRILSCRIPDIFP